MTRKIVGMFVCIILICTAINVSGTTDIKQMIADNDGTLSGYVNDTTMNPIEGALVRVNFHGTYEEDYTDSLGYYHVDNIPICWCMKNSTASKLGYKDECILLAIEENTTHDFVLSRSSIFYVGGSGPGNYSKIQDAIDNASDLDTVFVYKGIYYEHLKVEKNINLVGEDKEKTIIDAEGVETAVEIGASVRLSGFTIQNAEEGISNFIPAPPNDNYEFLVFENIIENNVVGLALSGTYKNVIYGNIIKNNQIGIKFFRANKYEVKNNNFINNEKHAHFELVVFLQFMPRINWNGNHWDNWKVRIPKVVKGDIVIVFVFRPGWVLKESVCPCYNIDWHPKTNPYDI